MEYVTRSECPQLLIDNQAQWTPPWIAHYTWDKSSNAQRPEKPTDSHWLEENIRGVLVEDFHKCCGYCGQLTPMGDPEQNNRKFGQVDHYNPKSKRPQLVYDWDNFIWCCENCNTLKGTFLDETAPLLNPCVQADCEMLEFNDSDGSYKLVEARIDDDIAKQRLVNQCKKTLYNNSDIKSQRRDMFTTINCAFLTLNHHIERTEVNDFDITISAKLLEIFSSDDEVIDQNIAVIKAWLAGSSFYLLKKKIYQQMIERYPLAAKHLANNDIGV